MDILQDEKHCGDCRTKCPDRPNAPASCIRGTCVLTCNRGLENCDQNLSTGCEVKLGTIEHCTSCTACPTSDNPRQDPVCGPDGCGFTCKIPYTNCDAKSNQCEVDLDTDPENCGSCGTVCPNINGVATCNKGQCMLECEPGYTNCDNDDSNGCETPLGSPEHCKSCDASPPAQHCHIPAQLVVRTTAVAGLLVLLHLRTATLRI